MQLHGETTIELTDVNTGEKTVKKEENMITNALQDICNYFSPLLSSSDFLKS